MPAAQAKSWLTPLLRGHLGFDQPVAVLFAAVLHFLTDAEDPAAVIAMTCS